MERVSWPAGTELGGYLLQGRVGAGGMGTVYQAQDADGRTVALKLLHPGLARDPATRQRLDREVRILQRLRVDGVARILDAELDGAEAFLVTEFIDGPTLAEAIDENGPFDLPDLAHLATELARMLTEIHAAGVIHRDLKPGNVILGVDGPQLIDFGIAQEGEATRLTGTGLVIGTPGYVAPELIAGGEPTSASDEWGLAAVVAFAATGRPPFGEGRFDVVLGRVASGASDLAGLVDEVARPLRAALAANPRARLRPRDLAEALTCAAAALPWPGVLGFCSGWDWAGQMAADGGVWVGHDGLTGEDDPLSDTPDAVGWVDQAGSPADGLPNSGPPNTGATRTMADRERQTDPPTVERLPVFQPQSHPKKGGGETAWDWVGRDDSATDWAEVAVNPWAQRPAPPRRRWLAGFLGCLTVVLATVSWPVAGLLAGLGLVLGHTAGRFNESIRLRRLRRGPRSTDRARAVAQTPFLFLGSIVEMIPAAAIGTALGWLTKTAVIELLTVKTNQSDPWIQGLATAIGLGLGILCLWWGPWSELTRHGTLITLGRLAPTRRAYLISALVALGIILFIVLGWRKPPTMNWTNPFG